MNRRDALGTSVAFAAASLGTAACGAKNAVAQNADHAHHGQHGAAASPVAAAAYDCVRAGDTCLAHCLALLSKGDTSMAGCAVAVRDMVAGMNALAAIASGGGKRAAELAGPLAKLCEDCARECQPHADHHPTCRACLESCQRLLAATQQRAG